MVEHHLMGACAFHYNMLKCSHKYNLLIHKDYFVFLII